jgi:hypothetical protein
MIGQLRGRLLGGVQVCIKGLDVAQPAQAKRRAVVPRPCRGHGAGDGPAEKRTRGAAPPGGIFGVCSGASTPRNAGGRPLCSSRAVKEVKRLGRSSRRPRTPRG